jgi:hypothetical protein
MNDMLLASNYSIEKRRANAPAHVVSAPSDSYDIATSSERHVSATSSE